MRWRIPLALLAAAWLAACGNDPNAGGSLQFVAELVKTQVGARRKDDAPRITLTRAMLADIEGPLLLATLRPVGAMALLAPVGRNRGVETYMSPDGASIALAGGVVVATRAIGPDLMAAEAEPVLAALKAGGGAYNRRFEHLDGENHIAPFTARCVLEPQGRAEIVVVEQRFRVKRFVERCESPKGGFANVYDIDGKGRLRRSEQWLSGDLVLELQQLQD